MQQSQQSGTSCVVCAMDTVKPKSGPGGCQRCPPGTVTGGVSGDVSSHDEESDCQPGEQDAASTAQRACLLAYEVLGCSAAHAAAGAVACAVTELGMCEQFIGKTTTSGLFNVTLDSKTYQVRVLCS